MEWTKEAEELLKRVPFFVRKKVKKEVENYLTSQGKKRVELEDFLRAKEVLLKKMASSEKGYEVTGCFGTETCPNAITSSKELLDQIEKLLQEEKLTEFLIKKVGGKLKAHHKFKVGLSECPNACSQIYIMDIALHGFVEPEIIPEKCEFCATCVSACEEGAITLRDKGVEIDKNKCIGCGACIKVCPTGALKEGFKGYKVYLGGKLGRHPRLATFLKIVKEEEVIPLIKRVVEFYKKENTKGERLGAIIERIGWEKVKKLFF